MVKKIKEKTLISFLTITLAIMPISAPLAFNEPDSEPPLIRHNPPIEANTGEDLSIEALIQDGSGISGATLYYRKKGEAVYKKSLMTGSIGNRYKAVIPSSNVSGEGMEYYIEAIDKHKNIGSDGSGDIPYFVDVKIVAVDGTEQVIKNPWYKKPWVWGIIITTASGVYAASSSGGGDGDSGSSSDNTETGDVTGKW